MTARRRNSRAAAIARFKAGQAAPTPTPTTPRAKPKVNDEALVRAMAANVSSAELGDAMVNLARAGRRTNRPEVRSLYERAYVEALRREKAEADAAVRENAAAVAAPPAPPSTARGRTLGWGMGGR